MTRCPLCRCETRERTPESLVLALNRTAAQMLARSLDGRTYLRLQLRILTAELEGYCSNHQWERAAEQEGDAPQGFRVPTQEQIQAQIIDWPGSKGKA